MSGRRERGARLPARPGHSEADIETVWNAVTLQTTPGIPQFMRPEIGLVQAGAGMDVAGRGYDRFTEAERQAVLAAFLACKDPHFRRVDMCAVIHASKWSR